MTLLFESFIVYYLLQLLVVVMVYFYMVYEPKQKQKKIWDPLGLLELQKEERNVRKSRRK